MAAATTESMREIVAQVQSRALSKGGHKSRFLALNLIVDYVEPYTYLTEHPNTVKEIIDSTIDTTLNGKYQLNFFESLLKKALNRVSSESEKSKSTLRFYPLTRMV